jgi:mannose-6-phosphate isomerase-like protein (cupin superfamily)
MTQIGFQSAELDDMVARARASSDSYAAEVLRSDLLSVGLYILPAGGADDQTPHGEDEVYYAVKGKAMIRVGDDDHAVQPGTVLFVPARAVHYFHHISEELILVVFWAPPEKSVQPKASS